MEQHRFIWVFNVNRVGKIEMKDNGITHVNLSKDIFISHDSNLQNEMSLNISGIKYIIPSNEVINNIIETVKLNGVDSLQEYADSNLAKSKI